MNFDALRKRRATYQRSKTLGSLPLHLIHQGQPDRRCTTARDSNDARTITEELSLLSPIDDSPVHVLSAETLRPSTGGGDVRYPGSVSPVGDGQPHVFRPSTSPRRRPSPSDFAITHGQGDIAVLGASKRSSLERSRSISAVLFTKVKDRIVEKMFQTATEGPQLAAIVQERRQRAADEYEARLQTNAFLKGHRKDQLGLQVDDKFQFSGGSNNVGSSRRIRGSLGSSPIKELPITEEGSGIGESETHERIRVARAAFRRRSISQDAAQMGMLLLQPGGGGQGKGRTTGSQNFHSSGGSGSQNLTVSSSGGGSQNFEGIVCSNDDFQAIVKMGQMAMQSTASHPPPTQKPRLTVRALSFNHGSFSPARGAQPGELAPLDQTPTARSNCSDDETSVGGEVGGTTQSTSQVGGGTTVITAVSELVDEDLGRTSVSTCASDSDSTTSTTHTAPTTGGVIIDTRRLGDFVTPGSPMTLATVPEIEYDENGQTWDVYGAEFDPEILGDAIQLHLTRLIERKILDMQQENSPPLGPADLASTRCRNDELKTDRKRSYRPEVKKRNNDDDDDATNSIFRYLCIFSKRRHSSDETV